MTTRLFPGLLPRPSRSVMPAVGYALSLKQPWAGLLVSGRKTIEIRRWPTARRSRILIHAARVSDRRPEAGANVPGGSDALTQLVSVIIVFCELTDCKKYSTRAAFAVDQAQHLTDPCWFQEPALYGFTCVKPEILPFHPCAGRVRF